MRESDCWPVCWEPVKSLTAFAMASWCNRTEWRKSGVSGGRGNFFAEKDTLRVIHILQNHRLEESNLPSRAGLQFILISAICQCRNKSIFSEIFILGLAGACRKPTSAREWAARQLVGGRFVNISEDFEFRLSLLLAESALGLLNLPLNLQCLLDPSKRSKGNNTLLAECLGIADSGR